MSPPPVLDLEILESDPAPTFVIKIAAEAIAFDILFCNEAFRKGGFRDIVLAKNRDALLFRSWTQAVGAFENSYGFGALVWAAEVAGRDGNWKVVRAADFVPKEQHSATTARTHSSDDPQQGRGRTSTPLVPRTNLTARLESIQTMMEMSDVGVFEYEPTGRLIHANDAWYRLSSHPKDLPAHTDFSFMDLVAPEDQDLVLSMWNSLVQGNAVTFEMRWKAREDGPGASQWVLSACVPVFDDDGKLISIAGNTIDINAQKKSQEAAVARVEALELARMSERKFMRFAELAPIAIFIFLPEKGMQYVNDQFFELTGHPRVAFEQLNWDHIVSEEDIEKVQLGWSNTVDGKRTEHMQFKLKKTWVDQDGVRSKVWVQGSSHPELDENGSVISIMGTLFDISHFKWAESVQRRSIKEALEAKRQQENFIDMTSHELVPNSGRNPLSAIIQCADSIDSTLNQLTSTQPELYKVNEEIATCLESLQTIVSCSLHQKRIIDDVLTLSKLDSNLLLITPIRVQPTVVVSAALKMFEVECSQMQISLELKEDKSLKGFEWVMLDPSRLVQIFINLITNAIKFTKDRFFRKITVTLGGSWMRPPTQLDYVTFSSSELPESDILENPEWGDGQKAFIWLKVEDTGCGMTDEEQKKLFSRFSQATPRTHVKYGGSGLGLFISKSLATLQGGSIGVASEVDIGSTFAVYVSIRLANQETRVAAGRPSRSVARRTESFHDAMRQAHLNILIVEDNLVNQRVLSGQLKKVGCNVSAVGNGVEALKWLRESVYWRGERKEDGGMNEVEATVDTDMQVPPIDTSPKHELDIILMDIEMPVMDGLTCARLIRDYEQQGLLYPPQPQTQLQHSSSIPPISSFNSDSSQTITEGPKSRLPILAVSANARSEQVQQALAAGMDDLISKPFRIPELWPKMKGLVERRNG